MDIDEDRMAPRFRALLEQRERELSAILREPGEAGAAGCFSLRYVKALARHAA